MISHDYKCIFIHIPKCAGTSIERALGHLDNHKGRGGQDHRSIRLIEEPLVLNEVLSSKENIMEVIRRGRYRFRNVANSRNKYTVTKEQYDSYFKFTFVRNPWARAYSWYKNVMRDEYHKNSLNISADISFKDFLKKFSGTGMLKPQMYWIKNFSGNIPLDFVGRFENLSEDFEYVCNKINANGIELTHEIIGSGEDYRVHYDKESIEIIIKNYKEEIDTFMYEF